MSSLTSMHAAIGTVPYMAPEQLLDARRVNESSDVYSVGTIMYRSVNGALPFDTRESLREKLQQEARPLETGSRPTSRRESASRRSSASRSSGRPAERYAQRPTDARRPDPARDGERSERRMTRIIIIEQ